MTKYLFTATLLFLLCIHTNAQKPAAWNTDPCATPAYMDALIAANPGIAQNRQEIEAFTAQWIHEHPAGRTVYTIPVVFHVVYQNATENIPDSVLMEQLAILNEDYRMLNADTGKVSFPFDTVAADCEINFCLATVDPSGIATTGITRTQTSASQFTTNDNVKYNALGGEDIWDRDSYLNIWVCDLSGGLLGYSQLPGAPAATDGVVLNYRFVGLSGAMVPYNMGRTGTHEVGHWLNLLHLGGGDQSCSSDDFVADTPPQDTTLYLPLPPGTVVTDNCSPNPPGVMWMSFMELMYDSCMYMFTEGQKLRMQACLAAGGPRASIAASNGCGTPSGIDPIESAGNSPAVYPNPASSIVHLKLQTGSSSVTLFDPSGRSLGSWTGNGPELTLDLSTFRKGVYFIRVEHQGKYSLLKIVLAQD